MRKFELFELITANKPREKEYLIDTLVRSHGHDVVRLPPYMCDFNLIELVWAKIKRIMREGNTTGNYSLSHLKAKLEQALQEITTEDTQGFLRHIVQLENEYWEKDPKIDDTVDEMIIHLGADSDSDYTEDEDDPDEFSDEDESNDSDLAVPLDEV